MLFHVFTFFWCYGDILVLVRLFCRATTSLLTVRDVSMRAGNMFNIVTIAITAAILITIFIAIMIIILTIQGRFAPWVVPRVWRDAHTEEAGPRQVMIIRRMVMVVIMLGEKPRNVSTDRASDKGKRMKGYTFCCETLTRNHLHPKLNSHQRRAKAILWIQFERFIISWGNVQCTLYMDNLDNLDMHPWVQTQNGWNWLLRPIS